MKQSIGWLANALVFAYLTRRCGKSIDKRDWEQTVFWGLLALATIMYAVKSAPLF
jgi:peptidoglycan biosynthesis protein MviN/MurJ (putative lipid II flippase)